MITERDTDYRQLNKRKDIHKNSKLNIIILQ